MVFVCFTVLCLSFLEGDISSDGDNVEELDPAVPVLLAKHEAARVVHSESTRMAFRRWGIEFTRLDEVKGVGKGEDEESEEELDVLKLWRPKKTKGTTDHLDGADEDQGSGYTQVMVKSVPYLLHDKVSVHRA